MFFACVSKRLAEGVSAGAIGHEEQVARARRDAASSQHGRDCGSAWRQAVDRIGVVGRGLRSSLRYRPAERALAADEAVDDAGSDQLHLLRQAGCGTPRRDGRARRPCRSLFSTMDASTISCSAISAARRGCASPDLGDDGLCLLHAPHHARVCARAGIVGFRDSVPSCGILGGSTEKVVVGQGVRHPLGCQASGMVTRNAATPRPRRGRRSTSRSDAFFWKAYRPGFMSRVRPEREHWPRRPAGHCR